MLKLRFAILPILALLLAACGTLSQTPTVQNEETNLESARYGGYLNVHFKKYVYGYRYGPEHAKYVFKIICRDQRSGKVVLRQNIELNKDGPVLDGGYWGVKDYECHLKEIADEYKRWSVGDKIKVVVYQHTKHGHQKIYDDEEHTYRETYESEYFYPKKNGKLYIKFYNYYYAQAPH